MLYSYAWSADDYILVSFTFSVLAVVHDADDTLAALNAGKRILDFAFSSSSVGRASFRMRHDASSPDNMSLSFKRSDSVSIILYDNQTNLRLRLLPH